MEIIKTEGLEIRSFGFDDSESAMSFWRNNNVMKYCGGSCKDRNQINIVIKE